MRTKGCNRWSRSVAWSIAAIVSVPMWSGCTPYHPGKVIATSGIPSVSTAPPIQQKAAIGATIDITTSTGRAAYTVVSLQRATAANEFMPVKGTLYSIVVTIQAEAGSVDVNPLYFNARTEDGTNLKAALATVENQLTYGNLPQGQKLSGPVGFDVPLGKSITEIVLADPLGKQLGIWSVS